MKPSSSALFLFFFSSSVRYPLFLSLSLFASNACFSSSPHSRFRGVDTCVNCALKGCVSVQRMEKRIWQLLSLSLFCKSQSLSHLDNWKCQTPFSLLSLSPSVFYFAVTAAAFYCSLPPGTICRNRLRSGLLFFPFYPLSLPSLF